MAQLSDDCFAFGGQLLGVDEALDMVGRRLSCVVDVENADLSNILGRVLAEPLVAPRAVPPHNNSAVDGYAVRFGDLVSGKETRLRIAGRIQAGDVSADPFPAGTAVRVFTGAAMPADLDTIFMQEDCREDADWVVVPPGISRGANYRMAGEDIGAGATVLEAGRRMRPADLGLIASLGINRIAVHQQLKVAVFSTGNELAEPGTDVPTGGVYDANRFTLVGLLHQAGYGVTDAGIVPDTLDRLTQILARLSREHHAIVASGGVSTGEADYVKQAVDDIDGKMHAWRLAIKPGRPVALGQIGDCAFIGLPGNPAAVVVTYMILARPLLAKLAGRSMAALVSHTVAAEFDYRKKQGRREYLRVTLEAGETVPLAQRFAREGAGILSSIVASDGLLVLDEAITSVRRGDRLPFLSWSAFD